MTPPRFPASLKGRLLVSCQAPAGDPLHEPDTLARIAASALRGGAGGLRANGAACIRAFRRETERPIIGIEKKMLGDRICITPNLECAREIARAGADVIAMDCTVARHDAAEPWQDLIRSVHDELSAPVLADIATFEEGMDAEAAGADAVATTLHGYTPQTAGARAVNWELIQKLVRHLRVPLVVEGNISQPQEAGRAIEMGAFAVVVGSAITRPDMITARFTEAMREVQELQHK